MNELPNRPASRIIRAEQADLWIDGYAFIRAAEERAQRIRDESAQWLEQAREQGFESARQQGAEQVAHLLAQTATQADAWLAGLEVSLADLAMNIVRDVLEGMDDAERILRCTRKALTAFRQDQGLTLFVPAQHVADVRQRLAAEQTSLPPMTVEADDQLHAGQARLSSPVGSVELGLDEQLSNIRRSLLPFVDEVQP